MKLMKYKKLIIVIIALIVIIAGTSIKLTKGMNYCLKWKKSTSISIHSHDAKIEKNDLGGIVKESFPGIKYMIQNLNEEEDAYLITIDKEQISQEEQTSFIEKVNTKYGTQLTISDIEVVSNIKVGLSDFIRPYIIPVIISVVIIAAYFILRYKKIGAIKIIENLIYGLIMPEWLYFSILAIFRIPVGYFALPIALTVYIVSVIVLIFVFEKEASK